MTASASHRGIIEALRAGKGLDSLNLPRRDGRLLIQGLAFEPPRTTGTIKVGEHSLDRLTGITEFRATRFEHLHFEDCTLRQARVFSGVFSDCVFRRCDLSHWRSWATLRDSVIFDHCDMRRSNLGAPIDGVESPHRKCQWIQCDLRDSKFHGEVTDSSFEKCRLGTFRWSGARLERVRIAGSLEGTIFEPTWGEGEPPNRMIDVDLTEVTSFLWTEFRHLDLERVRFPTRPDLIVIERGYRALLESLEKSVEEWASPVVERARQWVAHLTRWSLLSQHRGVFDIHTITREFEEPVRTRLIDLIRQHAQRRST